jgi:hypothetical protein
MTETAGPDRVASGPDRVASAEQIALSAREAAAAPPPDTGAKSPGRDTTNWARKVERLEAPPREGVRGTNVAGRRLTGPVQGFGKMWQKNYRMRVGSQIEPEQAIATWREHFPEFWPKGNRFAGALTGLNPGDVALLDLAIGGGVKLSTGVFVLYADAESFTLMTPQGHMFAGWITFSAEREGNETVVQAQVLMRANDPIYELGMMFGGHKKEDRFWAATMTALGHRLGLQDPKVETTTICVDSKRQWRNAGNIWHNSAIRSVFQTIAAPFGGLGRMLRHDKQDGEQATKSAT